MTTALATTQPASMIPSQAQTDSQLVALWLHDKSTETQKAYADDLARFQAFNGGKPLAAITLADLQAFADSLSELSANSQRRMLASIKSLLTFGQKIGYITFNVGAAQKLPPAKDTLAERILSEAEVHAMIALTSDRRDKVLLQVLYASAARVSELTGLRWRDVQPNKKGGQVTLFGKRNKTRSVVLSGTVYKALLALRGAAGNDDPVFVSQKGGSLDESQVWRIVRAAARRAGIAGNVSPHWLRHSHASHAIDRNAPVSLVRDTLGHQSLETTSRYLHARPDESSSLYLSI
jgi:integrase/recombinase XerD